MTNAEHAGARHTCALRTASKHTSTPAEQAGVRPPSPARRRAALAAGAVATLLSAACGAGDHASAAGGAGEGGSAAAGAAMVALSVGAVAAPDAIRQVHPAAGRYFVTVEATLHDLSSSSPAPAGLTFYTLVTGKGLTLTPSPASDLVAMPCLPDTAAEPGGESTCTLAFEVPNDDAPAELAYDDPRGGEATAPVAYTPPPVPVSAACDVFATYENATTYACGACALHACGEQAKTFERALADGVTCPSAGEDCQACPTKFTASCECQIACLGGCEPAYDAFLRCVVAQCSAACG